MQFKTLITFFLSALTVQAAVDANTIVDNVNQLTDLTKSTTDTVNSINYRNFFTKAPEAINNLRQIVVLSTQDISDASGGADTKFSDADQAKICAALKAYYAANEDLATALINKEGTLDRTPFAAPLGAVFRGVEGGSDALSYSLIATVPTCSADVKKGIQNVDEAFSNVISAFS